MAREGRAVGFSLMELLACLFIIVLLSSYAASGLSGLVRQEQGAAAIMDLRRLLNFARYTAVTQQDYITVCALDALDTCKKDWSDSAISIFFDANRNRQWDADEQLLRRQAWTPARGTLRWRAALARRYLVFKPTGTTDQNGTFYVCAIGNDNRHARAVIVNRAGRNYVAVDSDRDGIRENSRGENLSCE